MSSIDTIITQLEALGFENPANDSIYGMIAQAIGETLDNVLTEFDNTQNAILNTINTQRYGKAGYYQAVALAFQYGYDLTPAVGNLDPTYATIDATAQIVVQAAFQNNSGALSMKVAAQNAVTGLIIPLNGIQLPAFISYFINFQIPGLPISVVSLSGNIFAYSSVCTFNAGYNQTNLQTNLAAALIAFQTAFNTGNFNGTLYTDALSSYVKANVPGVIDYYIYNTTIDGAAFLGSTLLIAGYYNYSTSNTTQYNPISG